MLIVETITEFERLEVITDEWEALHEKLSLRMPFTTPLWCLTWWRMFQRKGSIVGDRLHSYVVRDQTGALVAIAPMYVASRPNLGPLSLRELQFFGVQTFFSKRLPLLTEWRGLICRSEDAAAATAALAARIKEEKPAHITQWRGLPSGLDSACLGPGFHPNPEMSTSVFYLDLPQSWDAFRQGMSRNIKEALRKCYNSLSRENKAFRLNVVTSPSEAQGALDIFFALHGMRATAAHTIRHPNVFEGEQRRGFLRFYCDKMARRGDLRIFQLIIDEKVVATRVAFVFGDELYLYFSGYDLAWARFSVMTTTVAEAIKWSIANKVRLFNLSTGEDVSKTRWRPQSVAFEGGNTFRCAPALQASFRAFQAQRHRRLGSGPVGHAQPIQAEHVS